MTLAPVAKRAKTDEDNDLEELVHTAWDHYRNYLDSFGLDTVGEGSQDADVDELQELIDMTKKRFVKPSLSSGGKLNRCEIGINPIEIISPNWESRHNMIPILLSVAYYHLADDAISQYLLMKQQKQKNVVSLTDDIAIARREVESIKALEHAQNLIVQSLEWYPYNAATWSMGANFGRMTQSLSLSSSRSWYEVAVQASTALRGRALYALNDESIANEEKEWIELLVLNQIIGVEYESHDEDEEDDGRKKEDQDGTNSYDDVKIDDDNEATIVKEKKKNHSDEEEDNEEDDGWYSASTVESTSRFMCSMLWSMEGRHDRALEHLKPFRLTHRLHPNVWRVGQPLETASLLAVPSKPPLVFQPEGGIIPNHLYRSMLKVFAPDASYWQESDYSTRGYYSFFHDYDESLKKSPSNLIEEVIINHLMPRAKQCLEMEKTDAEKSDRLSTRICGFEWWAHTRPIQANLGHNLHYDTDESMLDQEGKVTHPMLSSVLYLTGGMENCSSPAGATIILDETPDSTTVGEKCWQGIPKDNTFLIFPGDRLHGVLPCPGIPKTHEKMYIDKDEPIAIKRLIHEWQNKKTIKKSGSQVPSSDSPPQRLTFMVGFWSRSVPSKMKFRTMYGPCGPLPPPTEEHTWVSEIMQGYEKKTMEKRHIASKMMVPTALSQVSPAWELIEAKKGDEREMDSGKQVGPHPVIPHGIDHRFFVHDAPKCFRQSLFEDIEMCKS